MFSGDYLREQENQPWEYIASYTLGVVMVTSWAISTPLNSYLIWFYRRSSLKASTAVFLALAVSDLLTNISHPLVIAYH